MSFALRPYQKRVLNDKAILDVLYHVKGTGDRPDITAPLVVSATGTGKTAMFSALAHKVREWNRRTIILTHRREILEQTVKSLYRLDSRGIGQIQAGKPMTKDLIQVASVPTLIKRLSEVWRPDLILTDEAHHAVAGNSWGKIHEFWGSVPRIGFTATPARTDGCGLRASFDHMVMGLSPREATEDGYLTYPVVYTIPNEIGAEYHITRGDFDTAEQAKVMSEKKIVGDVIDHYRRRLGGAPTIVACVSLEHAELMADQFRQAGYRAQRVWGDMPTEARDKALQGLATGEVQVVTFDSLIGEGVDIPVCSGLIMLRRTQSLVLYLQWCGRVGRPVYAEGYDLDTRDGRLAAIANGGKPTSIILDHAGNFQLHGHPLADRVWSLDSTKRPRGEKPPATTTCPKCYGVWPGRPRTCPSCGWSFQAADLARKQEELRVVEGELVEAGLEPEDAGDMAAFVTRLMATSGQARQRMLLGKAFALATSTEPEETRKRKIELLAASVGVKEGWAKWAWDFTQKNVRRSG